MAARKSLDELKSQYIGKTYSWLTVLDVYRDEVHCKWMLHCKCKCGKEVNRQLNIVVNGTRKSCGCYLTSKEHSENKRKWCLENLDKIRVDRVAAIQKLKDQYVGKQFNWLEITDISITLHSSGRIRYYNAHCKCKCGKEIVTRLGYVLSGHSKSCGCYKTSKEFSNFVVNYLKERPELITKRAEGHSQWCKNNHDKLKEQGERHSQWFKDHPDEANEIVRKYKIWCSENKDKIKEQGERHSQYYKDNPEIGKNAGKKISQWYKNNPEKVKEKNVKQSQRYKDNPKLATEASEKYKQWCKDNPDKVKERSGKYKQYLKDNPEKVAERGRKHSQFYIDHPEVGAVAGLKIAERCKHRRAKCNFSVLLNIIHPDHIDSLINGEIKSYDYVKTKCPICGEYEAHNIGNMFIFSKGKFKYKSPPLCNKCKSEFCCLTSKYEQEIADYISTFYTGNLIKNDRATLNGKELDLFYPEKKIAIEFNGDYWHSSLFKGKSYHVSKYLKCKSLGITLVSIFESEWSNKKDDIKLYLKDLFTNKLNRLSLSGEYMNNNYPSPLLKTHDKIINEFYTCSDVRLKIYTCGKSKLLESVTYE